LPFSNEKLLLLLSLHLLLPWNSSSSKQRTTILLLLEAIIGHNIQRKQTSATKNNALIRRKLQKSALKDRLDSMVTQQRKNVEDKTKVEAIERLLSNNKRLRASYVLITKSSGKNISNQIIFN
jgi:hypothetical protein